MKKNTVFYLLGITIGCFLALAACSDAEKQSAVSKKGTTVSGAAVSIQASAEADAIASIRHELDKIKYSYDLPALQQLLSQTENIKSVSKDNFDLLMLKASLSASISDYYAINEQAKELETWGFKTLELSEKAKKIKPDDLAVYVITAKTSGQLASLSVQHGIRYGLNTSKCVKRALELDPENYQSQMLDGMNNIMRPPFLGGDPQEGKKIFERLTALHPENPEIKHLLALSLLKCGEKDKAAETFREVLQKNPQYLPSIKRLEKMGKT